MMRNVNCGAAPYPRPGSYPQGPGMPGGPQPQIRNVNYPQNRQAAQTVQAKTASCASPGSAGTGASCSCSNLTKEQLLSRISLTKFACVEANLYLDTHPGDADGLAYFQEQNRRYQEAMDAYAASYGPLTLPQAQSDNGSWNWVNQPWPWQ